MSGAAEYLDVAVLIATRNRPELLRRRALTSVASQTLRPQIVVVVNDGEPWAPADVLDIEERLAGINVAVLHNCRVRGVGGAWNTGISHLSSREHRGFVAILDDDDLWEPDHLAANYALALQCNANVVVAGLRIRSGDGEIPRPLIDGLNARDFLTGNPGWQGSNTFVDISLLVAVGGFRESLRSLHDRDIAVRLLRHPSTQASLLSRWTATWYIDRPGRLSDRRGAAKLDGLREFWRIYAAEMSVAEQNAFIDRAESLFGFSFAEITSAVVPADLPRPATGDLHA